MSSVAPNPHSPHADADPRYRHVLPTPASFGAPRPGTLLPTACSRLAVVPDEALRLAAGDDLPDGLCPACLAALRGQEPPLEIRPISKCACGMTTEYDGRCALCRQEDHDEWWPTRAVAAA